MGEQLLEKWLLYWILSEGIHCHMVDTREREREREREGKEEGKKREERVKHTLPKAQSSLFFFRSPPRASVRERVLFGGGRKWSTANCWSVCGFPRSPPPLPSVSWEIHTDRERGDIMQSSIYIAIQQYKLYCTAY